MLVPEVYFGIVEVRIVRRVQAGVGLFVLHFHPLHYQGVYDGKFLLGPDPVFPVETWNAHRLEFFALPRIVSLVWVAADGFVVFLFVAGEFLYLVVRTQEPEFRNPAFDFRTCLFRFLDDLADVGRGQQTVVGRFR